MKIEGEDLIVLQEMSQEFNQALAVVDEQVARLEAQRRAMQARFDRIVGMALRAAGASDQSRLDFKTGKIEE